MPPEKLPRLPGQMARLLRAPAIPQKTFIEDLITYQALYDLAYGLVGALDAYKKPIEPVVLYTQEKALTAAAMLAAAAKGTPELLLPYALNPNVLREIHAATGARRVVTDQPVDLPAPMQLVHFAPAGFPSAGLPPAPMNKIIARLFTGGTTGKPQVWPKTVSNLFGEAFFMAEKLDLSENDRFVAVTVPYHIYGLLFAVLIPLAASAGVNPGISVYPNEIIEAIHRYKATLFAGVPTHYRVLRNASFSGGQLRLAISSAGRLEPDDGAAFFRRTGVGVTEVYGSTETGGVATRNRAWGEDGLTPLAAVETRISGESLDVRSPFLSPNLQTDTKGFFRTNDRVREETGGGFVLIGRTDGVVKVGGKRVDLEGVQACLKELQGIADALVLSLPADRCRENEIVAVVEGDVDAMQIRQALSESVEPYALPRRIVPVDKIPMSAAGKYNRQAVADLFARECKEET